VPRPTGGSSPATPPTSFDGVLRASRRAAVGLTVLVLWRRGECRQGDVTGVRRPHLSGVLGAHCTTPVLRLPGSEATWCVVWFQWRNEDPKQVCHVATCPGARFAGACSVCTGSAAGFDFEWCSTGLSQIVRFCLPNAHLGAMLGRRMHARVHSDRLYIRISFRQLVNHNGWMTYSLCTRSLPDISITLCRAHRNSACQRLACRIRFGTCTAAQPTHARPSSAISF